MKPMSCIAETRRRVRTIAKDVSRLTPWERKFLGSLTYRNRYGGGFFTPRESEIVDRIFASSSAE